MKSITQTVDIFQIIRGIPLIEVARRYLPGELQHNGSRHVARCPFHDDRTPSLFIFPDGGWRCFGCQAHGDAVDLVAKLHNLRPIEAARVLAADFGIEMPDASPEDQASARKRAEEARRRREEESVFAERVNAAYSQLALLHRSILRAVDSLEAAETLAWWLCELPLIEVVLDGLQSRDLARQGAALDVADRRWLA